jgi:hypothetical protein
MTITSGLGKDEVPLVAIQAGGAYHKAELLKQFNEKALDLAWKHCAPHCMPEFTPATDADVHYEKRDFSGWTEVQMKAVVAGGTQGAPVILPTGTVKEGAFIRPKKPNVKCVALPKLPKIKKVRLPPPPPHRPGGDVDPPPPPPPAHDCRQPTFFRPKGTIVVVHRFEVDVLEQGKAYQELRDWLDLSANDEVKAVFDGWRQEVEKECLKLNGGMCHGELDPAEPELEPESGDTMVGEKLNLVYRLRLKTDVKGVCK